MIFRGFFNLLCFILFFVYTPCFSLRSTSNSRKHAALPLQSNLHAPPPYGGGAKYNPLLTSQPVTPSLALPSSSDSFPHLRVSRVLPPKLVMCDDRGYWMSVTVAIDALKGEIEGEREGGETSSKIEALKIGSSSDAFPRGEVVEGGGGDRDNVGTCNSGGSRGRGLQAVAVKIYGYLGAFLIGYFPGTPPSVKKTNKTGAFTPTTPPTTSFFAGPKGFSAGDMEEGIDYCTSFHFKDKASKKGSHLMLFLFHLVGEPPLKGNSSSSFPENKLVQVIPDVSVSSKAEICEENDERISKPSPTTTDESLGSQPEVKNLKPSKIRTNLHEDGCYEAGDELSGGCQSRRTHTEHSHTLYLTATTSEKNLLNFQSSGKLRESFAIPLGYRLVILDSSDSMKAESSQKALKDTETKALIAPTLVGVLEHHQQQKKSAGGSNPYLSNSAASMSVQDTPVKKGRVGFKAIASLEDGSISSPSSSCRLRDDEGESNEVSSTSSSSSSSEALNDSLLIAAKKLNRMSFLKSFIPVSYVKVYHDVSPSIFKTLMIDDVFSDESFAARKPAGDFGGAVDSLLSPSSSGASSSLSPSSFPSSFPSSLGALSPSTSSTPSPKMFAKRLWEDVCLKFEVFPADFQRKMFFSLLKNGEDDIKELLRRADVGSLGVTHSSLDADLFYGDDVVLTSTGCGVLPTQSGASDALSAQKLAETSVKASKSGGKAAKKRQVAALSNEKWHQRDSMGLEDEKRGENLFRGGNVQNNHEIPSFDNKMRDFLEPRASEKQTSMLHSKHSSQEAFTEIPVEFTLKFRLSSGGYCLVGNEDDKACGNGEGRAVDSEMKSERNMRKVSEMKNEREMEGSSLKVRKNDGKMLHLRDDEKDLQHKENSLQAALQSHSTVVDELMLKNSGVSDSSLHLSAAYELGRNTPLVCVPDTDAKGKNRPFSSFTVVSIKPKEFGCSGEPHDNSVCITSPSSLILDKSERAGSSPYFMSWLISPVAAAASSLRFAASSASPPVSPSSAPLIMQEYRFSMQVPNDSAGNFFDLCHYPPCPSPSSKGYDICLYVHPQPSSFLPSEKLLGGVLSSTPEHVGEIWVKTTFDVFYTLAAFVELLAFLGGVCCGKMLYERYSMAPQAGEDGTLSRIRRRKHSSGDSSRGGGLFMPATRVARGGGLLHGEESAMGGERVERRGIFVRLLSPALHDEVFIDFFSVKKFADFKA